MGDVIDFPNLAIHDLEQFMHKKGVWRVALLVLNEGRSDDDSTFRIDDHKASINGLLTF